MNSRRKFLRNGLLSAGGLLLGKHAGAQDIIPFPDPDLQVNDPDEFWKLIRLNFPLDPEITFLNNGTMGPSPYSVLQAVQQEMLDVNQRASYGGWYPTGEKLAAYFGADPDEICLTHNVTEGINIIAWGLALKAGDEIIISNHEHVGNALPWLNRARRDQLIIKVLDYNLGDDELIKQLNKLINKKTKALALPHIPCTTGRVIPLDRIGTLAKEQNIPFFVDGAHGAGMLDLKLNELPCDFYATCTHKWMLGPKGTGFLYIKKESLELVDPSFVGGHSDTGWNVISDQPHIEGFQPKAARNFYGTQSRATFAGVNAAIEFHSGIGKQTIAARIRELNDHLYSGLEENAHITILTPKNSRAGVVSFTFKSKDYMDFYKHCQKKRVIIRAVPECDVNCIRVSTHIYNSKSEIDLFLKTLNDYSA